MNTDTDQDRRYEEASTWKEGDRVMLTHDVDRFPHFLAPAGPKGTVTMSTYECIAVKLDEHLPGAEDWDNEVCWYPCNGDDVYRDTVYINEEGA